MDYGSISNEEPKEEEPVKERHSTSNLVQLFAFSFTNGLLMTTYPIATLPTESAKIAPEYKSLILAGFLSIAGLTQLSGPIAGLYSDRNTNPRGRRRPFMIWGAVVGFFGLVLQLIGTYYENWSVYTFAFTISILSLNAIFATMIGLVSDLVLPEQTGEANGIIGLLNACGALVGFGAWFSAGGDTKVMYIV